LGGRYISMCAWFGLIHIGCDGYWRGVTVCWDLSFEFWVVFGLPISCGDYTCFVRLSLSGYLYVGLDVLIWSYVYIQFPVVVVLFCCSGIIWTLIFAYAWKWPRKRVETCSVATKANKKECWHSSVYFVLLCSKTLCLDWPLIYPYRMDTQQDAYH
jgi:hypothetical protein